MARNSGARASDLLRLLDRFGEVIAFEFDLACTSRLQVYDGERETRMLQAASVGLIGEALSSNAQQSAVRKKFREGTF